ncbi:twin-arginine translocase TatA/TatE family subunit [Herbiconiux sp. P15]|uniref:twin-arginine translocase TatA/TatE family subunit n=1 Tax=Herbiconiux liukaitaii TaxID=3342799 RepID=UPI0035B7BF66
MGMLQNLTGWHALILLAVVLLFFGAAKLPALARSLGQSARILKSEAKDPDAPDRQEETVDPAHTHPDPAHPADAARAG